MKRDPVRSPPPARRKGPGRATESSPDRQLRQALELHERELRLLAYELHDGIVQSLVGAKMLIEAQLERYPKRAGDLTPIRDELRKAVTEARRLIRDLRPLRLESTGLLETIRELIREREKDLQVQLIAPARLPPIAPALVGALARIVQEALTNIQRHAKVERAEITVRCRAGQLQLQITDAGCGFDPRAVAPDRFGLAGIRDRARLFGGRAVIRSQPSHGTVISVRVPLS